MAHTIQARKRIRQNATNMEQNRDRRSKMRTAVKNFEKAIAASDKDLIATTFKTAMSELHTAVSKGIVKKQTASRKISRMAAAIKRTAA